MPSPGYLWGKLLQKMQVPTMRGCNIDSTAKVQQRSNLINVTMGRYSYMGAANSLSNVSIGSFCSIASYCAIGGGDHPLNYVSSSPVFLSGRNALGANLGNLPFDESSRVTIGNDVWIGEACFISAGVTIGDGAVIGAHSVVTHDVEPYSIVAGAPAREIRKRFPEEIIEGLLALKWWNWGDGQLRASSELFVDPKALLKREGLL